MTSYGVIRSRNDSPGRNITPVHLNVMMGDFVQAPLGGACKVTTRGTLLRADAGGVAVPVGAGFAVSVAIGGIKVSVGGAKVSVGGAGVQGGVEVTATAVGVGAGAVGAKVFGAGLGVCNTGLGAIPG